MFATPTTKVRRTSFSSSTRSQRSITACIGIPALPPTRTQIPSTEQSQTRTGILPRSAELLTRLPLQRALRLFRMRWIIRCSFSTLWFRRRRTAQQKPRIDCFGHLTKRVCTTQCTELGTARENIPSPTSLTWQRSGCTKTISASRLQTESVEGGYFVRDQITGPDK